MKGVVKFVFDLLTRFVASILATVFWGIAIVSIVYFGIAGAILVVIMTAAAILNAIVKRIDPDNQSIGQFVDKIDRYERKSISKLYKIEV